MLFRSARVTSATTAAAAGATVGQVPRHLFSLWNAYQVATRVNAGVGVVSRSDMFAAIDNTVVLPGYLRLDASASVTLSGRTRLQIHAENLTNRRYVVNADGNNNISPGSPRAVRVALSAGF